MRTGVEHSIATVGLRALPILLLAVLLPSLAIADSTLTLKFRDAGTGLPTDARVRVYRPGGWAFEEPDEVLLTHSSWQTGPYVHALDSLVIDGPSGAWGVLATQGITSIPVLRSITVGAPMTEVVELDHWIDPRLDGWFSADPHVHLYHDKGLHYPPVPHDRAAMAARGEGLDLMYLLENEAGTPGGPVVPAQPGVALVWGEEYRNSFWGHTVWLGLEELVWYPSSGAGCCGDLFPAWPTLARTFEEEDSGLRILAHPRSTDEPLEPFEGWPGGGYARERAALALGDQLHGFAVASASNEGEAWALEDYLDALRSGARWAAIGEGDRPLDRYTVSPPGNPRTYAWIGPGWSPDDPAIAGAWEAAVLDRRCYATTGPVVRTFEVEGVPMGGEHDAGSPGPVAVSFSVAAFGSLTRLTLHGATGTQWDFLPGPGATSLDTTVTLQMNHDDFVLLEVEAASWTGLVYPPRAVTSPVWVEAGETWPMDAALARRESGLLEAFFAQAVDLRGFDSPADSFQTWQDIGGAAAIYEAMVDDPPAPFELLQPVDSAQLPGTGTALQWAPSVSHDGEPVSYRVMVATDPGLVSLIVDQITADTHYDLTGIDEPTSLHWTVEALEPGEPGTPALNGPRSLFLTGGVVAAPPFQGPPLDIRMRGANSTGVHLSLGLRDPMDVVVRWVDVRGRVVGEVDLGRFPGGTRQITLAARDRSGGVLARGVYWLVAEAGPHREVVRVTWLR